MYIYLWVSIISSVESVFEGKDSMICTQSTTEFNKL